MNCEVKRSNNNNCIICNGTEGLKIIHKVYTEISASYVELLVKCFSIQFLDTHLGKYDMVCKQCIKSIRFCMDFRKQVEIAHKRLYNKMSTESSIYKHFKINKSEITVKKWTEIKPESDDEDNNASNTKHIPIHDNTKNLLAAEIETLSKIKEEFETMDYSDNTDTFHVTHDYSDNNDIHVIDDSSDNNDILNEEKDEESDSSSVKTDEIFRATEYKEISKKSKEKSSFSIPELEPTQTQCPLCEKQFLDNNLLNKHYVEHYPAYICHVCGISLMNYAKYKRHLLSHDGLQFPCDLCERKYDTLAYLNAHKRVVHLKQAPHICKICGKRFINVIWKKKHMLEAHGIKLTMHKCPTCDAEFYLPCHVERHVKRTHLKIKDNHCEICFTSFFDTNELKYHILAKHEGIKSYKCEMCDKTYGYARGLRLHRKAHHNHKGYECQTCGALFERQANLKHHLKTHEPSE